MPTISPAPTHSPTTKAPISPIVPTTTLPTLSKGCCTQRFDVCVSHCGSTENECIGCNQDVFWMPEGAPYETCVARWAQCQWTGYKLDQSNCCPGMGCTGDQYYAQCLPLAPSTKNPTLPTRHPTPTPPVTINPTVTLGPQPTLSLETPTLEPSENPISNPNEPILFSTTSTLSAWDAFTLLESITNKIDDSDVSPRYSVLASGGAAGNGYVVSDESQSCKTPY